MASGGRSAALCQLRALGVSGDPEGQAPLSELIGELKRDERSGWIEMLLIIDVFSTRVCVLGKQFIFLSFLCEIEKCQKEYFYKLQLYSRK